MTSPERPPSVRPVDYKGEPLDGERGPGLGCFRIQAVVLVVLIILTPLSVAWDWPVEVSIAMLFVTLAAAAVRGPDGHLPAAPRRRGPARGTATCRSPSRTPTVGQLEDAETAETADAAEPAEPAEAVEPAPSVAADAQPPLDGPSGNVGVQE